MPPYAAWLRTKRKLMDHAGSTPAGGSIYENDEMVDVPGEELGVMTGILRS
jgi:hypothetical protein